MIKNETAPARPPYAWNTEKVPPPAIKAGGVEELFPMEDSVFGLDVARQGSLAGTTAAAAVDGVGGEVLQWF